MSLQKITIQNARSLENLEWEIPAGEEPGWHVILGDNGAGKTTFLRATAMGLIGNPALYLNGLLPSAWVTAARPTSRISAIANSGVSEVVIHRNGLTYGSGSISCFSASYGPFRRFTGGDPERTKRYATQPGIARHLSLFEESVALTEALSWMQNLKFKQLEGNPEGELLSPILAFINQPGFLPNDTRVTDVTSDEVTFIDANGVKVPVENLSDGYRSILSMTFDLIRHMALHFGPTQLFSDDHTHIRHPGIVLVDEIDAHLHPTWQRSIGQWFRTRFPEVQFIVSTHSPLICQAAEVGSVFRLPQPGVAADRGEMITGLALKRLVYGNVLEAYGTGVFGEDVTRSESGKQKLDQLAELNVRELIGSLTEEEKIQQADLRDILPSEASITDTP